MNDAVQLIESATLPTTVPQRSGVMTPVDLLQLAVSQGADLERLERLMTMKKEYERDEARKAYNLAFSAFKAEAVRIVKNRRVTDGPLKGKSYAELFSVVNAVTPMLSKHGLGASWSITKDDRDWIEVTCTVKHSLGHAESVSMGGPPDAGGAKNAIMARASTVSYLERYTLKAILGLSEQDDDDNAGGGKGGPTDAGTLAKLLADLRLTKTDAEAFSLWKSGNTQLAAASPAYAEFKQAVMVHRRELKEGGQ